MSHTRQVSATLSIVTLCWLAMLTGCAHTKSRALPARPRSPVEPRELLAPFVCEVADPDDEGAEQRENEQRGAALDLKLQADHIRFIHHGSETDDYMFASRGAPCATARDAAACNAKLAELEATGRTKIQVFAIAIDHDALTLYQGEELMQLLGPIDNIEKGWLVLMIRQHAGAYFCNDPEWSGHRQTTDGYDFARVWTARGCPFERIQAIDHVDRAGHVTRLRTHVVERTDACVIDESLRYKASKREGD